MNSILLFSRDEATLYERVSIRPLVRWSVGWLVGPSVTLSLFGLLGATYGRVSGLVSIAVVHRCLPATSWST